MQNYKAWRFSGGQRIGSYVKVQGSGSMDAAELATKEFNKLGIMVDPFQIDLEPVVEIVDEIWSVGSAGIYLAPEEHDENFWQDEEDPGHEEEPVQSKLPIDELIGSQIEETSNFKRRLDLIKKGVVAGLSTYINSPIVAERMMAAKLMAEI